MMTPALRFLALIALVSRNVAWPQDPIPRLHIKHRKAQLGGDMVFRPTAEHFDGCKDPFALQKRMFREALYVTVKNSPAHPREVYDTEVTNHPVGAQFTPYVSIQGRVRAWRSEDQPPAPTDITDIAETLKSQQWIDALKYTIIWADEDTGRMDETLHGIEAIGINSDTGGPHVILGCRTFTAKFQNATHGFLDSTYDVAPNLDGVYQFLTMMLEMENVVLPCAFAIMSRKREASYQDVFNTMMNEFFPKMDLQHVTTDFEPAMQNAIHRRCPNAQIHGCLFHLAHAVLKYRQKLAVMTRIKKDHPELLTEAYRFERDLVNLAFLPHEFIDEAFENLNDALKSNDELYAIMGPLFIYYKNYWILKKGPKLYSVYKNKNRTNNNIERYHRSLKAKMSSNPEFHKFMVSLKSVQERAAADLQILEHGLSLSEPQKKKTRDREAKINRAWDGLGDLSTLSKCERKNRIDALLTTLRPETILATERLAPEPAVPNISDDDISDAEVTPNVMLHSVLTRGSSPDHKSPADDDENTFAKEEPTALQTNRECVHSSVYGRDESLDVAPCTSSADRWIHTQEESLAVAISSSSSYAPPSMEHKLEKQLPKITSVKRLRNPVRLQAFKESNAPATATVKSGDDVIGQRFLGNESHVEHFKLLERTATFVLIGARNAIYNISLHDLSEITNQKVQWTSTEPHRELCSLKGRSDDDCQNYVRVFGRESPNKFLACGTNAYKPQCRQFELKNGVYVRSESEIDGLGLCPYDPQHNSTAVFAGGQLYAATVADFSGGEPLIHREKIRTERSDLNQLNGPNFVSSFGYGDYVFFFYRETAVEYMNCGKAVYSRVGRVCQHDKGGPHAFSDRWTSFLKARLNCSVPGDYPFYFNEIQSTSDVTEGWYAGQREQVIYGVFTTPVNSIGGSAICAFSMSSVLEVFEGAFKEQQTINSNWLRVLADKVPDPRPGACVNDSRTLPDMTVNFVKTHPLMDDAVQSHFTLPVITKVSFNYKFTKVAVDSQVEAVDGQTYDILYIGTDDGRVLKALNTKAPKSLTEVGQVIVSDVQVLKYGSAVKDLQVVHLAGEASKLVVIADSEIRAVPLHHCDSPSANSCFACVALQDPHCAWDATRDLCVAVPTKLHDNDAGKTLFQDIANGKHKGCGYEQANVIPEMAKPVPPALPPRIGRVGEQPDERDNEIVFTLDRENQYSRTQPRANEPQGVIVTPGVYSASTLTGALIGTCFFSLIAGFASGFWFSQRLRGAPYPEPPEQRQQLNRLTESSESPAGFNNKSINLVLNVPPKNPNGKNANSSAENKPMQKVKKTYI